MSYLRGHVARVSASPCLRVTDELGNAAVISARLLVAFWIRPPRRVAFFHGARLLVTPTSHQISHLTPQRYVACPLLRKLHTFVCDSARKRFVSGARGSACPRNPSGGLFKWQQKGKGEFPTQRLRAWRRGAHAAPMSPARPFSVTAASGPVLASRDTGTEGYGVSPLRSYILHMEQWNGEGKRKGNTCLYTNQIDN